MKKKKAFTLSEVIVVLLLVGVIAAVLIPYLFNTFQKEKWTSIYKRTFSETYQALTMMALEEDCAKSITCTGAFHGELPESTNRFGNLFSSKMKVRTNCGLTKTGGNCFSHKVKTHFKPIAENNSQTIKETLLTNSTGMPIINWGELEFPYTFVTNRGVSYALFSFGTDCLKSNATGKNEEYLKFYVRRHSDDDPQTQNDPRIPVDDKDNQMLNLCGFIVIDVNGAAEPNVWGKDVFGMWITDTKTLGIYPFGGASDKLFYNKCKKNASDINSLDGRGCAARIIEDNWSIGYL